MVSKNPLSLDITAQGGVGTEEEHDFLIAHYNLDSVGWGSPFLLVPEATTVDDKTLEKLVAAKEDDLYLECKVKNVGDVEGKEVIQLYVKSANGTIEKPEKELKGFTKTNLLKAGEMQQISIKISINDGGYYDTISNSWKLDKGTYKFIISSNSKLPKLTSDLPLKEKIISTTQKLLSPVVEINKLSKQLMVE